MDEPKYKRVLLKISGEALAGEKHSRGLDFGVIGPGVRMSSRNAWSWVFRWASWSAAATSGAA